MFGPPLVSTIGPLSKQIFMQTSQQKSTTPTKAELRRHLRICPSRTSDGLAERRADEVDASSARSTPSSPRSISSRSNFLRITNDSNNTLTKLTFGSFTDRHSKYRNNSANNANQCIDDLFSSISLPKFQMSSSHAIHTLRRNRSSSVGHQTPTQCTHAHE